MSDLKILRTKKWFIRTFALLLILFILPFAFIFSVSFLLPSVYEDTFVGELSDKYDRLCSIDDEKIVVIGGSSVAFGLDSEMVEKQLNKKVVNFGLYADLGTKLMMDLSKVNINKGDIIILAPELNAQTLSLYFNASTALQAMDGNWGMLKNVGTDDYEALVGGMWTFASNKLKYLIKETRPENSGAYCKENFNEYGDNVYDRPYNEITAIQNKITFDFRTDFSDTVTTDYEEYINYVNDYISYCHRKGAEVYFSFCPMNEAAVDEKESEETIKAFYNALRNDLDCKIISNINDYILNEGYFYDSEFHLNNSGVVVRTVRLIDDIKRVLGDTSLTMLESDIPGPSGFKPENTILLLEQNGDENNWIVVGLTDEGKNSTSIVIPSTISGKPVVSIASNAFKGANKLETIELGDNIVSIYGGAFSGAYSLKEVVLAEGIDADSIKVSEGLLNGSSENLEISVDENMYQTFLDSSSWSAYKDKIKAVVKSYFEYITLDSDDGSKYLAISALTEGGKKKESLTIPDTYNNMPVRVLKANAFESASNLKSLKLGANITIIEKGALNGATSLEKISIPSSVKAGNISISAELFETNIPSGFKIYVSSDNYSEYLSKSEYASIKNLLDTENKYLILTLVDDYGGKYWKVSGVLESAKAEKIIYIPDYVDDIPVTAIGEKSFAGSSCEKLYLGNNITSIQELGFYGAEKLVEVYLPETMQPERISVPNMMSEHLMTEGANENIKFFVGADYLERFKSDYFWSPYGSKIYAIEN